MTRFIADHHTGRVKPTIPPIYAVLVCGIIALLVYLFKPARVEIELKGRNR